MRANDQTSIARFFQWQDNRCQGCSAAYHGAFRLIHMGSTKIVEILWKSRDLKQYSYFEKEHNEHKEPGAMGS